MDQITDIGRRSTTVTVNGLTETLLEFSGDPQGRLGVNVCNPSDTYKVSVKLVRSPDDTMSSFTDCDYVLQPEMTLPIEARDAVLLLAMNSSAGATTSPISVVEVR